MKVLVSGPDKERRKKEKRDKGKNPLTRKKELFSSEKQGGVGAQRISEGEATERRARPNLWNESERTYPSNSMKRSANLHSFILIHR